MPFTFSHPLAVVPLARWGLVFVALVVGSMSPDFAYFVPVQVISDSHFGHTSRGLLAVDLPSSLAILWVFDRWLRLPLLSLLPVRHQQRLIMVTSPVFFWPARRFLLVVASILIGAMTHIVWDSFTHQRGWVVLHWPALRHFVHLPPHLRLQVFKLAQYLSSVIGGALLLWLYGRWLARTPPQSEGLPWRIDSRTEARMLTSMAAAALVVGVALATYNHHAPHHRHMNSQYLRDAVTITMGMGCAALAGFCAWWHRQVRTSILTR